MNEKILFILTGGTLDSSTKGLERDVLLEHSSVPAYLQSLKSGISFEFIEMIWKDSRDVTNSDRTKILETIEKSDKQKIIITHGTFTMADTGKFLKQNASRKDQVIILTGSIVPLPFADSDAQANLKFAIEQAENLSPGVYICFNKRVFNPEEAVKDIKTGKFYSKQDKE